MGAGPERAPGLALAGHRAGARSRARSGTGRPAGAGPGSPAPAGADPGAGRGPDRARSPDGPERGGRPAPAESQDVWSRLAGLLGPSDVPGQGPAERSPVSRPSDSPCFLPPLGIYLRRKRVRRQPGPPFHARVSPSAARVVATSRGRRRPLPVAGANGRLAPRFERRPQMRRVRWLLVLALLLVPGVSHAIQLHWSSGADTLTFTEATRAILVLRADSAEVTLPPEWRLLWVGDSTEVEVVALDSLEVCEGDTAQVYGVDGPSTPEDSTAHRVTAHFCSGGSSAAEPGHVPPRPAGVGARQVQGGRPRPGGFHRGARVERGHVQRRGERSASRRWCSSPPAHTPRPSSWSAPSARAWAGSSA